jgi:predicted GIY-YIG superfamily endonuclease
VHVYAVWRHSGSKEVYIGTSADVERRFHGHFMKRTIAFLPTISQLEHDVRHGKATPYYEIVETVTTADSEHSGTQSSPSNAPPRSKKYKGCHCNLSKPLAESRPPRPDSR